MSMQGVKAVSGSKAEEEKKATTPLAINLDGERNWITEMETGPRKNETATRSTATDRVCVRPEGPADGYGTNHRGLVDMAVPSPILAAQQCDIKDAY